MCGWVGVGGGGETCPHVPQYMCSQLNLLFDSLCARKRLAAAFTRDGHHEAWLPRGRTAGGLASHVGSVVMVGGVIPDVPKLRLPRGVVRLRWEVGVAAWSDTLLIVTEVGVSIDSDTLSTSVDKSRGQSLCDTFRVQELCEQGGVPGLSFSIRFC